MGDRYNVINYDGYFGVEDTCDLDEDGNGNRYRCYDECRAELFCLMLNEHNKEAQDLKKLLVNIIEDINYDIDNERSYGDEYTAEVLNDIKEKYDFDNLLKLLEV